jgi:enamine deaminase RidA (YjgF/YER057c/UK114 family)
MHDVTNPANVPAPPGGWYSHSASVPMDDGKLLFVSGQIALDDDGEVMHPGDMAAQSERVFELIERVLADQGGTFDDVVNLRTYVTDMASLPDYGRVRAKYLTGRPPTSTTVQVVRLFRPEAVVEVEVVASIGRAA